MVARRDERFPVGWRPVYALTLYKDSSGRQLCHMASTWQDPLEVRSTALNGYWSPPMHEIHNCPMVVVCRWNWGYTDDPAPGPPPSFAVTVVMVPHPSRHDGSILTDQGQGRRVFLDMLTASAQDHERFIEIIGNNVPDSVAHNINLYRFLLTRRRGGHDVPPPPPPPVS